MTQATRTADRHTLGEASSLAVPSASDHRSDTSDTSDTVDYRHLDGTFAAYAHAVPGSPRHSQLRDELVAGYLPVAHHIARRYANRGEPLDDLKQVACLGLVSALNRYRPELSRNFLAYAIPTITGEVRRHFRDRTWSMRVPRRLQELTQKVTRAVSELTHTLGRAPRPSEIAAAVGVTPEQVLEALEAAQAYHTDSLDHVINPDSGGTTQGDRFGTTDSRYELITCCHSIAPHLAALPARDREILILRFYEDMTQTQIAQRLGISQMQVSRLLARTLDQLHAVLTTDDEVSPDPQPVDAPAPRMPDAVQATPEPPLRPRGVSSRAG